LLIHDDIMDRDKKRRGDKTVFYQYVELLEKRCINDPYHTGEAMGICAGDFFFFLAFRLLNQIKLNPESKTRIFSLCSEEMCRVAMAQIYDVYLGADRDFPHSSDILTLYKYKTGRYTFSLPLIIGAVIAGADKKECELLEKTGELLGIIFQIKDDGISLYGSEEITGKSADSDIKEGKKTLYMSLLFEKVQEEEKDRLLTIINNSDLSTADLQYIKNLIQIKGIESRVDNITAELKNKALNIIKSMNPLHKDALNILLKLIDYNQQRSK